MKIIVRKTDASAKITIDTEKIYEAWQMRNALKLALSSECFADEFIMMVFNEKKVEQEKETNKN